jgi:hypothetical protein
VLQFQLEITSKYRMCDTQSFRFLLINYRLLFPAASSRSYPSVRSLNGNAHRGHRYLFHPSIAGIIVGDTQAFSLLSTQQFDSDRGAEGLGDPSEHAQGMTFVGRRFPSADLLLGRAHPFGKLLLREAGFLSQGGRLRSDIPRFPSFLKRLVKAASMSCSSRY